MSQRSVEILLGRLITDETFRQSFFPVRAESFEQVAASGLELTAVERDALSSLRRWRVDFVAQTLDQRLSRSPIERPIGDGRAGSGGDASR